MKKFAQDFDEIGSDLDANIKNLVTNVKLDGVFPEETEHKQLGVWIPLHYKEKYEKLQKRSGRKFSRVLAQLAIALIERASKIEDAAS